MMRQYLMTGEGYDPFGSSQLPMSPGYGNVIAPNLDKYGNPKPMDVAAQAKAMNALQDWAQIGSDPAVLGGMYGQMPGQGQTTYQALPGQTLLSNASQMQGTLEQLIADEILNGGSAASALNKIRSLTDPNSDTFDQSIADLVPTYTKDNNGISEVVPDESYVRDIATQFQKAYLEDQRTGAVVDPNTGLLSTADTTEDPLAQWYRETGTPLPNETYSPDMLATPSKLQGEQRARERFRGTDPNGMPPMGAAQAAALGVPAPQYGGGSSQAFNEANAAAMRYLTDPSGLPTYNNLTATPGKMVSDSQPQGPGGAPRTQGSGPTGDESGAVKAWWAAQNGADATMNALGDAGRGFVGNASKVLASPVYAGNAIANLFRGGDKQNSFSMDDLGMPNVDLQGVKDALFQERNMFGGGTAEAAAPQPEAGKWLQGVLYDRDEPAATTSTKKGKPDVIKRADRRASKIPAAVQKKREQAAALDWANRGTHQQNRIDQQVRDLAMKEIAAAGHTPYNDTMMQRRMMAQMAGFGY